MSAKYHRDLCKIEGDTHAGLRQRFDNKFWILLRRRLQTNQTYVRPTLHVGPTIIQCIWYTVYKHLHIDRHRSILQLLHFELLKVKVISGHIPEHGALYTKQCPCQVSLE